MTAELVAMNANAVAMAADSAITLSKGKEVVQTYFSTNKLFSLSYDHPVGIMLYEGISIHSVPWETIIKFFREKIKNTKRDTLVEYANDFLTFINDEQQKFFPTEVQEEEYRFAINSSFMNLHAEISKSWFGANKSGNPTQVFSNSVLESKHAKAVETLSNGWMNPEQVTKSLNFIKKYTLNKDLHKICRIYKKHIDILSDFLLADMIDSYCFGFTGIVFAGFGEKDIFPSSHTYILGGVHLGDMRIEHEKTTSISHFNRAEVIPFAQTDMVNIFMKGISDFHDKAIRQTFVDQIIQTPNTIIDAITDLTEQQKLDWKKHFFSNSLTAAQKMLDNLSAHIYQNHTEGIIQGLKHLTKDELAYVTEALVSLSTLHKKVSPGDDTVGGPVDTAVISKGDGFVWIKRKHYFTQDLNPQFFARFSGFQQR